MYQPRGIALFVLNLLLACFTPALAAEQSLLLSDGTELSMEVFPAATSEAKANILWIPSEYGVQEKEVQLVKQLSGKLSDRGFSIWLPDFFASWFLPATSENMAEIGHEPIQALIQHILHQGHTPLIIITADKGAVNALRALHSLQMQFAGSQSPLTEIGIVLLNPDLNISTPAPGEAAQYWPVTSATNLPVFILQGELSPWRWSLRRLVSALEKSGSNVFTQVLTGVRDRFYFRPDATAMEDKAAAHLPDVLIQAMTLLSPYMGTKRKVAAIEQSIGNTAKSGGHQTDNQLPVYHGKQGKTLKLKDLDDHSRQLMDYRGKVVLLNFWASWCPPCVHEIPSMVRLKQKLDTEPFEILATNLGENPATIRSFLQQHPVNFPVLLDDKGEAVKTWGVAAYPTSYIIDKSGKIRFALFGGFEWDNDAAIQQIRQLLDE